MVGAGFAVHCRGPLPWLAQVSTAFGVAITDADADGVQDLVLVHNFFSPEPEPGRSDDGLGLWLRGLGGMRFVPVPGEQSGLLAAGDAKALALLDLGGGVATLLIMRNDASALLLVPALRGGRGDLLSIRLRGPAGNPTGVGARCSQTIGPRGIRHSSAWTPLHSTLLVAFRRFVPCRWWCAEDPSVLEGWPGSASD